MGKLFTQKNRKQNTESLSVDTALAFRVAQGDKSAFEELVVKYERLVSTCVYGVVGNTEDTLDVSQEVFLKVYKSISRFKGESEFSTWLYRVAKNCAYDFVRKKKPSVTSLDTAGQENEGFDVPDTSTSSNPEEKLLRDEKMDLLREALNKLSDEHREIIILRDINNYSYDMIAQALRLETGTVKSRIFRAREALKKILEKENYF